MKYTVQVGRLHPSFFDYSNIFKSFKIIRDEGDIRMISPLIVLDYDCKTGMLSCDDKDVLEDFRDLISDKYGVNITREQFHDEIDWNSITDSDFNTLNAGVCVLDDIAGWDGSINAIWFDFNPPGEVVDTYFQYWNRKMLHGSHKLTVEEADKLGRKLVLPNLFDSLVLLSGRQKEKVNDLITELI